VCRFVCLSLCLSVFVSVSVCPSAWLPLSLSLSLSSYSCPPDSASCFVDLYLGLDLPFCPYRTMSLVCRPVFIIYILYVYISLLEVNQ
jgi:hypothetical protein